MTTLTAATKQWSDRPADERYKSLEDLHNAVNTFRAQSKEAPHVPYASLRTEASGDDVLLVGKSNVPSKMTHWAFGQLAQRVSFPADPLRGLPPTLAAQVLNHKLSVMDRGSQCNLLLHANGGYLVRALTSERYTRIWNNDITSRLIALTQQAPEWQPAPAAFDGSRGLYASDHDMFAFLVDNNRRIFEKSPGGGLGRGFFVANSEVGAASFWIMTFFYEYVCGNHRVWGASNVTELKIRHTGTADDRAFHMLRGELKKYAEGSAADDEAKVEKAMTLQLGKNKDEVLNKVFGLRVPALTKGVISDGYDRAVKHADWYGSPRTVWGLTGGITEVARDMPFTDDRVAVERATGKLMQVAF
jgi:hypothetical protein